MFFCSYVREHESTHDLAKTFPRARIVNNLTLVALPCTNFAEACSLFCLYDVDSHTSIPGCWQL